MGKSKKLSKKEKAKLEAEQQETLRIEMEKERLKKQEEDRERKMRERRDAKKKQEQEAVENKLRRIQLRESTHALKKSKQEIKRLLAEEKLNTEWEQYMRCNGLPNADEPSDLRKYIHMWIEDFKNVNRREINWLLRVNEESILTQDQTVADLSRANLRKSQPNVGEMYAKRTTEVLGILDEMDAVIMRDQYNLSPAKLDDLLDLKLEIRSLLATFIDEFTFKILSNIERNMNLSGLNQATYKFESSVFKMELYTLRDTIPLPLPSNPKDKMKEEKTNIEFSMIQMSLLLPSSVKCTHSAVRALWLNYDHLSDYCFSTQFKYDDTDRKKLTLRKTTKREWKKRKELLQKALFQIFHEKPDENAETDSSQPRQIDVDKMYTEYEDEMNAIERKRMGPDALNLGEFEVNLRRNKIVGGVFQIEYLEQPLQDEKTDEGALLRTLIHPVKLKKKDFHYPYRAPQAPQVGQKRAPEEIEQEIKHMEENMEKMVLVNVDLPSHVSWFEPPIVCRFETEREFLQMKRYDEEQLKKKRRNDDDFDEIEEADEFVPQSKKEIVTKKPTKQREVKVVEDFNLLSIPKNINLKPLFEEFVIPMIPDGYEIKYQPKKSSSTATIIGSAQRKSCYTDRIYSIDDIVYQTPQPHTLFPNCKTRKVLKIVKQRAAANIRCSELLLTSMSSGHEPSSDEENDESMYSLDSTDHIMPSHKISIYMFSKFMRDLEDLIDLSMPTLEKKLAEMSSNLARATDVSEKRAIDRKDSGVSLTKAAKSLPEETSDDSDAESETDDDEEENSEIARNTLIDKIVKEANMKRCSGRWSTRDIHDVKFNEDKLTIQFRTGRLGLFALASNRYCNFPFQSWDIKPKAQGIVGFILTASQLVMDISITEKGIILNTLQGSNNPTLFSNVIGTTIKLDELIKLMRNAACDVFPSDDSFCYIEGSCEKNYIMEMHIYECMAYFAASHNFAWSRWNHQAGSRTGIFLTRELIEHRKLPNQLTVHVTPFKTCLIDCTEVSPNYCSTPLPNQDYYADLYQLTSASIQPISKSKLESMSPLLRQNVLKLLKSIRPLSFC